MEFRVVQAQVQEKGRSKNEGEGSEKVAGGWYSTLCNGTRVETRGRGRNVSREGRTTFALPGNDSSRHGKVTRWEVTCSSHQGGGITCQSRGGLNFLSCAQSKRSSPGGIEDAVEQLHSL